MRTLVPSARIVADAPSERAPVAVDLTVSVFLGNFFAAMGSESLNEVTYKPSISSALEFYGFTVASTVIYSCPPKLAFSLFCSCLSIVC